MEAKWNQRATKVSQLGLEFNHLFSCSSNAMLARSVLTSSTGRNSLALGARTLAPLRTSKSIPFWPLWAGLKRLWGCKRTSDGFGSEGSLSSWSSVYPSTSKLEPPTTINTKTLNGSSATILRYFGLLLCIAFDLNSVCFLNLFFASASFGPRMSVSQC